MRVDRHEVLLAIGLTAAVVVAVSGQTASLFEAARQFEGAFGLGLLPGLAIATLSLLVYIQSKRRQLQGKAAAAAEDAFHAQERTKELERLLAFWQALTQSFDLDAIRDVVETFLSEVTGSQHGWVATGTEGNWTALLGPATVETPRGEFPVIDLAIEALAQSGLSARPDGIDYEGQICFPMIAAGMSVGVLGVPARADLLTPERRIVLGAAAALLGISVRSATLLKQQRDNTLRDPLTGCDNRAHGMEMVATELMRARRSHQPLSLIMFDLDRFKTINDRFGHLCGDAVLSEVGATMRSSLRASDVKCRYGGEEFFVLLPDTTLDGAYRAAETLRRQLSELAVQWQGQAVHLTSSFGVACARPNEIDPTPLIARADEALYRAKRAGRNCVHVADEAADAAEEASRAAAADALPPSDPAEPDGTTSA